jgi:hypothetical protein
MPSSKSKRTAGPTGAATKSAGRKPPRKPHKPPQPPEPPEGFYAEPPIVVTSGSIDIDIDKSIFPAEPGNPNKHKNANRNLTSMEIQDLSSPPTTLMVIDLKSLAKGKCKILIKYEK